MPFTTHMDLSGCNGFACSLQKSLIMKTRFIGPYGFNSQLSIAEWLRSVVSAFGRKPPWKQSVGGMIVSKRWLKGGIVYENALI